MKELGRTGEVIELRVHERESHKKSFVGKSV